MVTRHADVSARSDVLFATGPLEFVSWAATARDRPQDLAVTVTVRDGHDGAVVGAPVELAPGESASGAVAAGDRVLSRGLHVVVDGELPERGAATIEAVWYRDDSPMTYGDLRDLGLVT